MRTLINTAVFLRNKYIIALAGFLVLMLFIDRNDFFVQLSRYHQLNNLLATKKFYQQQLDETEKNLADLQTNSAALEKYARENYLLKRDNEDIFVVSNSIVQKKPVNKQ